MKPKSAQSTLKIRALATLLPLLVVASAGCDIAMADHSQKATAEWKKTYEIQPGGRFEVTNVNGKIDVQPADGNTVEVVATKIGSGATPEAAKEALDRIKIEESVSAGVVARRHGVRTVSELDLPPGQYQLRVNVRGPARSGNILTTLEVPDFEAPLTMGGVALSTASEQTHIVSTVERPRVKLPAVPTPRREFEAGETLTVFTEVYESRLRLERSPSRGTSADPGEADIYPVFDDDPPPPADVRIDYETPSGRRGAWTATVVARDQVLTNGECSYGASLTWRFGVTDLAHHADGAGA